MSGGQDGEGGFSDAEREAMRERAAEGKKAKRRGKRDLRAEGEADIQAKLAEMPEDDRAVAAAYHAIVSREAPDLVPRTWYGMPAYANADKKVVTFVQVASKFDSRYTTVGFNDAARLDDGVMWPTTFAVTEVTPQVEQRLAQLVRGAVGA